MAIAHAFRAARGYSSYADDIIDDFVVIEEAGRVVASGALAQHNLDGLHVTDFGDVVLGPGLIDVHVHLHFDGGDDPVAGVKRRTDSELRDLAADNARLLLSAGVTTARDLGSRGTSTTELRDRITAGLAEGPTLLVAGSPVTSVDGHTWYLGGSVASIDEMVALVDRQAAAGTDWVKVCLSGGFLTNGTSVSTPQFGLDEMRTLVAAARRHGLSVAAHAHSSDAVAIAAQAGVRTIEHATFLTDDGHRVDADTVSLIAGSDIIVCPTANCATKDYPSVTGMDAVRRIIDLRKQGVRMAIGTDAGVRLVTPDRYADSLFLLRELGLAPTELLVAATIDAAAAIEQSDDAGTLHAGMRADFVTFTDDPKASLDTVARPLDVVARGRVASRTLGRPER